MTNADNYRVDQSNSHRYYWFTNPHYREPGDSVEKRFWVTIRFMGDANIH